MSKILKVTLEFDDKILTVEGPDAEEWQRRVSTNDSLAWTHGWVGKSINWKETKK